MEEDAAVMLVLLTTVEDICRCHETTSLELGLVENAQWRDDRAAWLLYLQTEKTLRKAA